MAKQFLFIKFLYYLIILYIPNNSLSSPFVSASKKTYFLAFIYNNYIYTLKYFKDITNIYYMTLMLFFGLWFLKLN